MSSLCQSKLVLFHSEIRRKDLDKRMNMKRNLLSKDQFVKDQFSNVNNNGAHDESLLLISKQIEFYLTNGDFKKLYELMTIVRTNYIYDKYYMNLLRDIAIKLIDFCSVSGFMHENPELFYECSWILVNFVGLEKLKIGYLMLNKLFKIFIQQINSSKNLKFQKEVLNFFYF